MVTTIEHDHQDPDPDHPSPTLQRLATLVAILLPFFGLVVAVYGLWGWGLSWVDLCLMIVMYTATGLGITVGYHRLFTHRAFRTIAPLKFALGVLGSMAVQGPLLRWVATHRRHHQHSDQAGDPHSPNHFGGGFRGVILGWWHAHIAWMFRTDTNDLGRYVDDLRKDRLIRVVHRLCGLWVVLGLVIPCVAAGLITRSWTGALLGVLWGGLVRIFFCHHVTWSINSVCHLWGRRPFKGPDESRNNFACGWLAFGEGWHNNHHAFPTSARHGLRWWELDTSYLVIRLLQVMGLAWQVRVPSKKAIAAKRMAS